MIISKITLCILFELKCKDCHKKISEKSLARMESCMVTQYLDHNGNNQGGWAKCKKCLEIENRKNEVKCKYCDVLLTNDIMKSSDELNFEYSSDGTFYICDTCFNEE